MEANMAAQLKLIQEGKDKDMDRQKALEAALAQIDRAFGKGSAMKLGARNDAGEAISTGSLGWTLRWASAVCRVGVLSKSTGRKARARRRWRCTPLPRRRRPAARRLCRCRTCAGPGLCQEAGRQHRQLIVSQPDTGEQALEIVDTLVRSNAIDVLVVDSVAALVPRAEIEGEMGDSHVGLQARLMSQALRKLTGSISRSRCMVIFINQVRMKIGVMYGNPETTTGGNAKFYASVRLDIRRTGQIKDRDDIVGNATRVGEEQGGPALQAGRVRHHVWRGYLQDRRDPRSGREGRVVEKSGAWFSYDRSASGRDVKTPRTSARTSRSGLIENAIRARPKGWPMT
jgi:recombination protein RecA